MKKERHAHLLERGLGLGHVTLGEFIELALGPVVGEESVHRVTEIIFAFP